jgi:hypothetical protein
MIIPAAFANALMPCRKNKTEDVDFHVPRVWKMSLTEASEREIFGNVSPYRTAPLPPLPWGNEQYCEKKLAVIDEEQVKIYNARMEKKYESYNPETYDPERIPSKQLKPGIVAVFRAAHDVVLENVEFQPAESASSSNLV